MDAVGIVGIILALVGFAVSYWQFRRAAKAEENLKMALNRLPYELLNNVSRFLESPKSEIRELYDLQESERRFHTSYADLNGDGDDELLVQYPYGAHAAVLQVYGLQEGDLKLIDEITTDTMAGFLAQDIDADGRIEVVAHEVSGEANFPYVMGFRDEVWYRLDNGRFIEVNRIKLYSAEDLEKAHQEHENCLVAEE